MEYFKGLIFGAFAVATILYLRSIARMQDSLSEQIKNVGVDVVMNKVVLDDLNSIDRQAQ